MELTTDVKKQHTVPRFLLDHFGFGKNRKKRKIFTFDKQSNRTFIQSVLDATTRNSFYNIEDSEDQHSLEPFLGIIESNTAPVIKKLIREKSLENLSKADRKSIAEFILIQRARTYNELLSLTELSNSFKNLLLENGVKSEELTGLLEEEGFNDIKNRFLKLILEHLNHVPLLLGKHWILYETNDSDPFYISDNPITLHNDIDMGLMGNLGLALEGIQIHLPISSNLTLALVCPTIAETAIKGKDQLKLLISQQADISFLTNSPKNIFELAHAFESGVSVTANKENVRFLNSLQVSFSEQFVFCKINEFSIIEEMIQGNKQFRQGPRPTVR